MYTPEDDKSSLNFPDNKSMFSQFDVMSQYSYYIDSQHQTKDEKFQKFKEFKTKQQERKKKRENRQEETA